VVSFEGDSLGVYCSLGASEICPDKRGGDLIRGGLLLIKLLDLCQLQKITGYPCGPQGRLVIN
jgi:hypothetical protein